MKISATYFDPGYEQCALQTSHADLYGVTSADIIAKRKSNRSNQTPFGKNALKSLFSILVMKNEQHTDPTTIEVSGNAPASASENLHPSRHAKLRILSIVVCPIFSR